MSSETKFGDITKLHSCPKGGSILRTFEKLLGNPDKIHIFRVCTNPNPFCHFATNTAKDEHEQKYKKEVK